MIIAAGIRAALTRARLGRRTGTVPEQVAVVERVTPANILVLAPHEIFVFGSNSEGRHAGGAARVAWKSFGAVWGQPFGLQGQSFAVDTMSGMDELTAGVEAFLDHAEHDAGRTYLVTELGCGIAGYTPGQVAPLFARRPANVVIPQAFHDVLDGPTS